MSRAPPPNLPAPPDVTTRGWDEIDEREVLEYRAETDTYWARFDDTEPVYLEVLSAVATISGVPPEVLPSMYTEIGRMGVEELISLEITETVIGDVTVSLSYAGHEVRVYSDGAIAVKPSR